MVLHVLQMPKRSIENWARKGWSVPRVMQEVHYLYAASEDQVDLFFNLVCPAIVQKHMWEREPHLGSLPGVLKN